MKLCPQCKKNYDDETLNFCLDDGSVLVSETDPTTQETIVRPTERQTAILPSEQITESLPSDQETLIKKSPKTVQNSSKKGVSPLFAYLTVGLLALLVLIAGVALFVWINSNSSTDSNIETAKQISNSGQENTNRQTANVEEEKGKLGKEKQDFANENTKNVNGKKAEKEEPKPTKTPEKTPTPTSETWFVILGSFPQSAQAQQRLQFLQSKGINARIINTNSYPGLRSGLNSVVLGPYSKSAAQSALSKVKTTVSDAYVKDGS